MVPGYYEAISGKLCRFSRDKSEVSRQGMIENPLTKKKRGTYTVPTLLVLVTDIRARYPGYPVDCGLDSCCRQIATPHLLWLKGHIRKRPVYTDPVF